MLLVVSGSALKEAVREILRTLGHAPYVFNLGDDVLPETPRDHIGALARWLTEPLDA